MCIEAKQAKGQVKVMYAMCPDSDSACTCQSCQVTQCCTRAYWWAKFKNNAEACITCIMFVVWKTVFWDSFYYKGEFISWK